MLCTLEIANNHGGNLDRGIATIREFAPLIKEYPWAKLALKLQYRFPSILHPTLTTPQTERFRTTMLSSADRLRLVVEARLAGFAVGCTPFDEESVELMREHGFDFVKVASASLCDWPLLERIVTLGLPTIASTAGASDEDVQRAAQFLVRRVPRLILMHCTGAYPTKMSQLRLDRIETLSMLVLNVSAVGCGLDFGYSTHEDPNSAHGVTIAAAKGCRTFEWHIGLEPRNAYSLSLEQCRYRLTMLADVLASCNAETQVDGEAESLHKLRRGVYAKRDLDPYEKLSLDNVAFQLPSQPGQLLANDWSKYARFSIIRAVRAGEPILRDNWSIDSSINNRATVQALADKVLAVLKASGAVLPKPAKLTLSHHHGLAKFEAVGCGMVEVVNGDGYAKKLIVMLPGQRHPAHKHHKKTETFYVLYGDCTVSETGASFTLPMRVGESVTVKAGGWHAIQTQAGCVLEEVSTALLPNDSSYAEPVDANRKTEIWCP